MKLGLPSIVDGASNIITVEHIKGHSDDHIKYDNLALHLQLNVDAESPMNGYINHHWLSLPQQLPPTNQWSATAVTKGDHDIPN